MIAAWVLMVFTWHGATSAGFSSQEACMVARNMVLDRGVEARIVCVPTGYGEKK